MLKSKSLLGRNKRAVVKPVNLKGKQFGSVKLRKKKHRKSASIADTSKLWKMSSEDLTQPPTATAGVRTSEIHERDMFLDLLSQVQDNRYDNQRYTLKAGSVTDESNPEEEQKVSRSVGSPDSIIINGSLPNGRPGSYEIPYIEISPTTDSPPKGESFLTSSSITVADTTEELTDNATVDDEGGDSEERCRRSLTVSPPPAATSLTPGRRSMQALQKVISEHREGPYPMLIEPPDGGFWLQHGEHDSARGTDGVWTAPEIDTEHYTIQTDKTAFVYGRYFMWRDHRNYIARDSKVGPVLLSVKTEEDYQGTMMRALLRTQKATYYNTIPMSQLPSQMEPEEIIKFIAGLHGEELFVENAIRFDNSKVGELIRKFDEHPVAKTHKFGVIYQECGQTSEEEIFGNKAHPSAFDEFLDMLGDKVKLKGFTGYRGGLDVNNDQTGEYSVYSEYKDRQIMFHVSTLLPLDASDSQHVQRKRHIGNDIVVIVFQDKNTPFCPKTVRSHFVHCYIVVQVEHPHTDHTVYKVALTAKDEVPDFSPPLPDPAVFQKGPEFREWLLTKLLNAEFNCHSASDFKRLATRTRSQLFLHLVEEIALTLDDPESSSLAKRYAQSLLQQENSLSASRSPRRWRRRTLGGIFTTKPGSSSSTSSKRKSLVDSPRNIRKMMSEGKLFAGSTPDLTIDTEKGSSSKQRDSPPVNFMESLANGETSSMGGKHSESQADLFMSKVRRRLTLKGGNKEKDPEKAKSKKPKRTASMDATTGLGMRDLFFKRRKDSSANNSPATRRSKPPMARGASEDSTISSNWNVPYELEDSEENGRSLENIPFSESAEYRNKWRSTPTILERQEGESGISISGVRMSAHGPLTADVAIQVGSEYGSPVFKFPSPTPPSESSSETSEKRTMDGSSKIYDLKQVFPHSLPTTPSSSRSKRQRNVLRKLPTKEQVQAAYADGKLTLKTDPLKLQQYHERSLPRFTTSEVQTEGAADKRPASSEGFSNDQYPTDMIFRAESTESISSESDEVYDAVMHSLQALKAEVGRLNELNLRLSQQNVKFASQNRRLKIRHFNMKQQLEEAEREIKSLHANLTLYQPNFIQEDSEEDDQ